MKFHHKGNVISNFLILDLTFWLMLDKKMFLHEQTDS